MKTKNSGLCISCLASLDKLGWVGGFRVEPFGLALAVRSNSLDALARVRSQVLCLDWSVSEEMSPWNSILSFYVGAPSRRGRTNYSLLYDSSLQLARSLDVEEVYAALDRRVHLLIARFAHKALFVRCLSFCVGGEAVLVFGLDEARLAPVVAQVCARGALLLSARFAVLAEDFHVRPYPAALDEKNSVTPLLVLGVPVATASCPLGRVVFVDAHADGPQVAPLGWASMQVFGRLATGYDAVKSLASIVDALSKVSVVKCGEGDLLGQIFDGHQMKVSH